ncbi:MAG: hypothetical protein GAK32_01072 [Pseudomonas fluorescens]|nr:MAG: hypothetical protein GAK32_01072 [Pseudomonas fluorescens]
MSVHPSYTPLRRPRGWRVNVLTQAMALAFAGQTCSAFAADGQPEREAVELAPVTVSAPESGECPGHSVWPVGD